MKGKTLNVMSTCIYRAQEGISLQVWLSMIPCSLSVHQVSTICVGMAASMATVLLCAGAKGKRYALPHATIHMHQALGGTQGQAADIVIAAKEIVREQRYN